MDSDIPPGDSVQSIINTLQDVLAGKARELIRRCASEGILIKIVSAHRTFGEQARLYEQGRTTPGPKVTNARPGKSWHNYRRAFDVAFITHGHLSWDGPFARVAKIAKSLGLEWGGDFKSFPDYAHFQYREGMTLLQARQAHDRQAQAMREARKSEARNLRDRLPPTERGR